jgi:serine/threonine protein kinase/CHASE2 domain-containing sensor protein
LDSSKRIRALMLAIVALGATTLGIVAYGTHLLRSLELSTVDTRFSIRGNEKPPSNIVIVGVDSGSFSTVNKQWPFPRAIEGKVFSRIAAGHPKAIAYDIVFSQPSSLGQNDDVALATAINNFACQSAPPSACAGNNNPPPKSAFSIEETSAKGNFEFLGSGQGATLLQQLGARPGSTFFPFDPGGYIRRLAYFINKLPTFPVVTAQVATGKRVNPKSFPRGSAWVDYAGPAGSFPQVSFGDVYAGKVPPAFFRGKIVEVGVTAPSLHDVNPTPTDSQMPGVEIQANAVSTILRGFPLSAAPGWVNILLIIALGLAVPLAGLRLGPPAMLGLAIALGAVFAVAVQLAFQGGTIVAFVYPMLGLVLSAGGAAAVGVQADRREHQRLRSLFAASAPVIVEQVLSGEGPRGLEPTEIIAGYRIESVLGRGGMGVVYRATQLSLDRPVAIKLIAPERAADPVYRERFKLESRAAATIDHPNVIPVHEAGEDAGLLFIAMRLVEGADLAAVLARGGAIDPRRATALLAQLAAAIDVAHAHRLVHRDIKPANVLLTFDQPEHLYLTDFGVARRVGAITRATDAGQWVGTIDYLAPEQISGESVDGAADVYAATCLLHHCLTGQVPFPRDNEAAQLWAHINAPPPAPSQLVDSLPSAIDGVIARGMAKNPRDRFGSAVELAYACSEALGVPLLAPAATSLAAVRSERPPRNGDEAPTAISEDTSHSIS